MFSGSSRYFEQNVLGDDFESSRKTVHRKNLASGGRRTDIVAKQRCECTRVYHHQTAVTRAAPPTSNPFFCFRFCSFFFFFCFSSFHDAVERLTGKPTVTSEQRGRQQRCRVNVHLTFNQTKTGDRARARRTIISSPATANVPGSIVSTRPPTAGRAVGMGKEGVGGVQPPRRCCASRAVKRNDFSPPDRVLVT